MGNPQTSSPPSGSALRLRRWNLLTPYGSSQAENRLQLILLEHCLKSSPRKLLPDARYPGKAELVEPSAEPNKGDDR